MDSNNFEINLLKHLTQKEKDSQLIIAADNGLTEEVKELVNVGANLESLDQDENTPLRLAARAGHFAMAEFLIKAGANLEAKNDVGSTPLMAAAGQGYPSIVSILIKAGANLNAVAHDGDTALMRAADDDPASARLLVNAGADIELKNEDRYTALIWAAAHGEVDTVDLLIQAGANLNVASFGVNTPLMVSCCSDRAGRLENSFRLISSMSDEQIAFSIKTTPRDKEGIKIKERVEKFKKAVLENQKKMFDILDTKIIKQNVAAFVSSQEFESIVTQLSQDFPIWYTHRIATDLKLVCSILLQIRGKRPFYEQLVLNQQSPETLLEERYCRQHCINKPDAINSTEKSFFYDTAATISSGCIYILNKASAYLPSFTKIPVIKIEMGTAPSNKRKHEDNDCEELVQKKDNYSALFKF